MQKGRTLSCRFLHIFGFEYQAKGKISTNAAAIIETDTTIKLNAEYSSA